MSRLLFLLGGVILGTGVGSASQTRGDVWGGAVIVLVVVVAGTSWFAGQRDRASAVAVAVAKAQAVAAAAAEARAAAVAQAAVNLYMTSGAGLPAGAREPEREASGVRPGRHAIGSAGRGEITSDVVWPHGSVEDPLVLHELPGMWEASDFLSADGGEVAAV